MGRLTAGLALALLASLAANGLLGWAYLGQRAIEAQAARAEAAAQARTHHQKADAILATPPAVPGNDCRSAQLRVDNWLKGRAQP